MFNEEENHKRVVCHEGNDFLKKLVDAWNIARLGILVLSQVQKNVAHVQRLPKLRRIFAVCVQRFSFLIIVSKDKREEKLKKREQRKRTNVVKCLNQKRWKTALETSNILEWWRKSLQVLLCHLGLFQCLCGSSDKCACENPKGVARRVERDDVLKLEAFQALGWKPTDALSQQG